jgi:hypothetical protein
METTATTIGPKRPPLPANDRSRFVRTESTEVHPQYAVKSSGLCETTDGLLSQSSRRVSKLVTNRPLSAVPIRTR